MGALKHDALDLLCEIVERRAVSDAMIRHNRQTVALNALSVRGCVTPETYANGLHWLPTDVGLELARQAA